MPVLLQAVLVFVPLFVSTANAALSLYALAGLVWKPLLSPDSLVTAAFAAGLIHPLVIGAGVFVAVGVCVGVDVFVAVGVLVEVGVGVSVGVWVGVDVGVSVGVNVGVAVGGT